MTIIDQPLVIGTVALSALWLFIAIVALVRKDDPLAEKWLLVLSCALAIAGALFLPSRFVAAADQGGVAGSGCPASASEGTKASSVRSDMGEPTRVVKEDDTRGPGAEAWVYEQSRCVVHTLNDQVDSVDDDR